MNKIINDIICVFIKEWWQACNNKKLVLITLSVSILPLIGAFKCSNSLLPMDYLRNVYLIFVSFFASSNIMQTIIIDEINFKTLDVLVTSRLSKLSIIIGKLLLGVVFGLGTTIISLLLLYVASFFSPYLDKYQFVSMFNIIASLEISIFASLLSMMIALSVKNIQVMTIVQMILVIGLIYIIYKLITIFTIPMWGFGVFIAVVCVLLTYYNVKLICIKNYNIRK